MLELEKKLVLNLWFISLSQEFQQFILKQHKEKFLHKGQALFHRGDVDDGLYAIIDGELNLGFSDLNGNQSLILIATPILWFGEISLIDAKPRTHDAIAASDVRLLHLEKKTLLAFLDAFPHCWHSIAQLLSQKIRPLLSEIESHKTETLQQRLARRLLLILKTYDMSKEITHPQIEISQEKLALLLSTSRQSINTTLSSMEHQKIIKRHFKSIQILDLNGLKQLAGSFL